jgi:hypothetical protein
MFLPMVFTKFEVLHVIAQNLVLGCVPESSGFLSNKIEINPENAFFLIPNLPELS